MTITFVGHGYVGLVTAAIFADLGNTVWVIGHTPEKIENLKKGILPIYEPGLEEIVKRNVEAKRLLFTLDYDKAVSNSKIIFIAVGTPPKETGEADLSTVFTVAEEIGKHLTNYAVVAIKSTVPVGTNRKVQEIINKVKKSNIGFNIASVPEFLREGQAISDTLHPDRIIIGTEAQKAQDLLLRLHEPITGERVLTNIESAELIKYASNAFLATKISFANAISEVAELTGADGVEVLKAVGIDKRIGGAFLNAGVGIGGSCFPKDVKALITIAGQKGYDFSILKSVQQVNTTAIQNVYVKIKESLDNDLRGKTVAVLGLSFKPNTDDIRDAPSLIIIDKLLQEGAKVRAYDPIAISNAKKLLPKDVYFAKDAFSAVEGADLLAIITEWDEFKVLDLNKVKKLMKQFKIVDGRNIYDPKLARDLGFYYKGVGR